MLSLQLLLILHKITQLQLYHTTYTHTITMNPSSSIITLFFAFLLPSCAAQFLEDPPCNVCGDGIEVGNPDAVASLFHAPSGAQILCGTLEKMGLDGRIAPSQCAVMPSLIGVDCGCKSINSPIAIGLTNTAIEATATEAITAEATATATEATWSGSSYSYSMSISSLKSKSTKVAKSKSTKLNHPILWGIVMLYCMYIRRNSTFVSFLSSFFACTFHRQIKIGPKYVNHGMVQMP